jgi:hypothetical protein
MVSGKVRAADVGVADSARSLDESSSDSEGGSATAMGGSVCVKGGCCCDHVLAVSCPLMLLRWLLRSACARGVSLELDSCWLLGESLMTGRLSVARTPVIQL